MMRAFTSLRSRLMLLMLTAALPAFAVIAYLAHWQQARHDALYRHTTLTLAQALAEEHQKNFDQARLLLATLAQFQELRGGRDCRALVEAAHAQAPRHIANLFVAGPAGDIRCSAKAPGRHLDVAAQAWFREALAADGPHVGGYHISLRTGEPTIVLSHTLRRDGRVTAVLAAALDLSWLARQPYLAGLPAGAAYGIFDQHGNHLMRYPRPTKEAYHNIAASALWRTLLGLGGPATFHADDPQGLPRLFAYAPLGPAERPHARLLVGVPKALAEAEAQEVLRLGLLGLAAAGALGLVVGWLGGWTLVLRHIRPIFHAVGQVAAGNLAARAAVPPSFNEISQLAGEVDAMAAALEERDRTARRERDKAQAYLDLVNVMVVALDRAGNITLANRKTCELLGCGDEGHCLRGNWFDQFVPYEAREATRQVFQRLMESGGELPEYYENPVRTLAGEQRLIAWRNTVLRDEAGRITGTLSAGEDITERERLQNQLQQAQKMEALGQLTGGIAHDFNNILASVLGFAKLALRRHAPDPGSELAEYLREIIVAGERARDLVAKMLAFGRAQPGRQAQPLAPLPLAKEAVKMLAATIPSSIRIEAAFEPDLPDIAVDSVAFHQILVNLVINARDAIGDKGTISIGLRRHQAKDQECTTCHRLFSGDYVELAVADDGPGIAAGVLARIFEPFYTTKEVGRGSGMGLAMVHGLVGRAGGHFKVESRPREGASFRIYLPVAAGQPAAADAAPPPPAAVPARAGRVLVVDDEPALLRLLTAALADAGWRASTFDSPVRALEAFRAAPDDYDAVISDQTMPELTGMELTAALHRLRPGLPVLLCSGYSDGLTEESARRGGARHLFHKPVDVDRLAAALAEGGDAP